MTTTRGTSRHPTSLDTWVAKHLSDLKTLGLDADTIVFFFGDNGGCLPRSKGHKFVTGVGVPLIVYIPPKWQHLTTLPIGVPTSRLVGFEDFAATVLSLAGLDTPSYMTGQAFLGSKAAPPRKYEYSFRSNYEYWRHQARAVGLRWALSLCALVHAVRAGGRAAILSVADARRTRLFRRVRQEPAVTRTSRVLRGAAHRGSLRFAD